MHLINLTDEERQTLLKMIRLGKINTHKFKGAIILLKADEGLTDKEIMAALNVSRPCAERVSKHFVSNGIS